MDAWPAWCNRAREGSIVKTITKNGEIASEKKMSSGLVYLAQKGQLKKVKRLLPRTHVHEMDEHGACALHQASREGHVDVMTHLIAKGADVNAPGEFGRTPLMYAAECKITSEPLVVLLASGAYINDVDAILGASALDIAAQYGRYESVELLLRNGANPLQRDRHGMLPLHRAAQHGSLETLTILLVKTKTDGRSQGQNSTNGENNEPNKINNTPAIHEPKPGSEFQSPNGSSLDAECHLMNALTKNSDTASTNKPQTDTTVNVPSTKTNATPLHCAAAGGKADNVRFLLTQGASIDGQMRDGSTALHISSGTRGQAVAEVLLDKGARVNVQKKGGFTPLATACAVGDLSMSVLLLENGADAGVRGDNGWCPLHFAVYRGEKELARLLLPHCDPNATTNSGDNVLLLAIKHNHQDLANFLVPLCDINHVDSAGNTALHCAAEVGNVSVIRQLLKHGAGPGMRNVRGETPIQVAANKGHGTVVKYLLQQDKELLQEFIAVNNVKLTEKEMENQAKVDSQQQVRGIFQGVPDVFNEISDADFIKFVLHQREIYTKL